MSSKIKSVLIFLGKAVLEGIVLGLMLFLFHKLGVI